MEAEHPVEKSTGPGWKGSLGNSGGKQKKRNATFSERAAEQGRIIIYPSAMMVCPLKLRAGWTGR